jgi:excisionase family DNA binding protein
MAKFQVWLIDSKGKPVEELITLAEAADMLGVTLIHVYNLCAAGELTRYSFSGKCKLVPLREVQDRVASYEDPDGEKRGRPRSGLSRKGKK